MSMRSVKTPASRSAASGGRLLCRLGEGFGFGVELAGDIAGRAGAAREQALGRRHDQQGDGDGRHDAEQDDNADGLACFGAGA